MRYFGGLSEPAADPRLTLGALLAAVGIEPQFHF
jgi:hypothetical protein